MKQLTLPFLLEKRVLDRQRREFKNIGDLKKANYKPMNTAELMLAQLEALDTEDTETIRYWLREDYLSKHNTPVFDLEDAIVLDETRERIKLLLGIEATQQEGLINSVFEGYGVYFAVGYVVDYGKLVGPEFLIGDLKRHDFLASDPIFPKDLPLEKVLKSPLHEALARDKRLLREFARRMHAEIQNQHLKGNPNLRYEPHLLMGFDLHGYNPYGALPPKDRYGPNQIYFLYQSGISTKFRIGQIGAGHNGVVIGFKQS
ncbi:hypothetical protein HYY70_04900 [Candidatus Woesearchaeota archaeon]|nr:hypothetical protein [Candidatus Woesearchaeota archaeon]